MEYLKIKELGFNRDALISKLEEMGWKESIEDNGTIWRAWYMVKEIGGRKYKIQTGIYDGRMHKTDFQKMFSAYNAIAFYANSKDAKLCETYKELIKNDAPCSFKNSFQEALYWVIFGNEFSNDRKIILA